MEPTQEQLRAWWEHKPAALVGPKEKFGIVSRRSYEAAGSQRCGRGDLCLHAPTPAGVHLQGERIFSTTWGPMHSDCTETTLDELRRYGGPLMTVTELEEFRSRIAAPGTATPGIVEEPSTQRVVETRKFDDMYPEGATQNRMIEDAKALGEWIMVKFDKDATRGRAWHVATRIE